MSIVESVSKASRIKIEIGLSAAAVVVVVLLSSAVSFFYFENIYFGDKNIIYKIDTCCVYHMQYTTFTTG